MLVDQPSLGSSKAGSSPGFTSFDVNDHLGAERRHSVAAHEHEMTAPGNRNVVPAAVLERREHALDAVLCCANGLIFFLELWIQYRERTVVSKLAQIVSDPAARDDVNFVIAEGT